MVYPGDNLPSTEGQRDYMLIQPITADVAPHTRAQCDRGNGPQEGEYVGHSVSIVRYSNSDPQVMRYSPGASQAIYYDSRILNDYGHYSAEFSDSFRSNKVDQLRRSRALYYSADPFGRADEIYRLLELEASVTNISISRHELLLARSVEFSMLALNENKLNHIDRTHVPVLLSSVNVSDISAESLHTYINNTYVNIIHDCQTVCSQSVLSDRPQFLLLSEMQRYSLLCVNRILETRVETQSTPRTILAFMGPRTTKSTAAAQTMLPKNNLPSLNGHRYYTRTYNLHSVGTFEDILNKCNQQHNDDCTVDCGPQLHLAKHEYVGRFLEILRQDNGVTLATIQQATYRIKYYGHKSLRYYISDLQTRSYTLGYNQSSIDIRAALAFAHNPASIDGLNALNMIFKLVDERQELHIVSAGLTTYNREKEIILRLLRGDEIFESIDRHSVQLVNANSCKQQDDQNIRACMDSTRINIVYDCNNICLQSALAHTVTPTTNAQIKQYGLLCTSELLESMLPTTAAHTHSGTTTTTLPTMPLSTALPPITEYTRKPQLYNISTTMLLPTIATTSATTVVQDISYNLLPLLNRYNTQNTTTMPSSQLEKGWDTITHYFSDKIVAIGVLGALAVSAFSTCVACVCASRNGRVLAKRTRRNTSRIVVATSGMHKVNDDVERQETQTELISLEQQTVQMDNEIENKHLLITQNHKEDIATTQTTL